MNTAFRSSFSEEEIEAIKDLEIVEDIGFSLDDWVAFVSNIPADSYNTQDIYHWMIIFVEQYDRDGWHWGDEGLDDIHVIQLSTGVKPEVAEFICGTISPERLREECPSYWLIDRILAAVSDNSKEFLNKINCLPFNETSEIVIEGNNICCYRLEKSVEATDDHPLVTLTQQYRNKHPIFNFRYHTTDWNRAERILTNGIPLRSHATSQDFGGTTPSFLLNHQWDAAINWKNKENHFQYAILVYNMPIGLTTPGKHILDLCEQSDTWVRLVRDSRQSISNLADQYDIVVGPQCKNGKKVALKKEEPVRHESWLQTAVKRHNKTKILDENLVGVLFYSSEEYKRKSKALSNITKTSQAEKIKKQKEIVKNRKLKFS